MGRVARISIVAVCGSALLGGCKAREMGVAFSPTQSAAVDASWLQAARNCWPALAHSGFSDEGLAHNLADPIHFRNTFAVYATMSDGAIEAVVSHPVSQAPEPEAGVLLHAATPVLSRAQAVSANPQPAPSAGSAPADAFCAIHNGTPVGFK